MKANTITSLALRLLKGGLAIALATAGLTARSSAAVNAQEQAMFNLIKNDSGQQRPFVVLDPTLCEVARAKAQDMANRGYFDHTDPDGHGPNYLVRKAGYQLPANYDQSPSANNIESASAGRSSAQDTWEDWKGSAPHAEHLLAKNSFYREQTSVGVGYANVPGSDYTYYWIVLTAPPDGPKVTFSSPANNSEVNAAQVDLSGTTTGDPDAASVQVRVGDGAWVTASGTKNWSATVSGLVAGANTIQARSLKADGAVLDDASRTVRYVVLAPLTVNVSGNGTVTSGFAGTTMREQGASVSVTAKPATGYVFAGWTGGITSSDVKLTFTMPASLSITANFVANPFVTGAGRYAGVFNSASTNGLVKVNLTSTGSFTARVKTGSQVIVFTGSFDSAGNASLTTSGVNLSLHYANGQIAGSVSGPGFSSDIALDGLVAATTTSTPFAGKYTVVLPSAENAAANIPQGDGVAVVKVAANGVAKITGTLADGVAFTASSPLGKNGEFPVFGQGGLLAGVLQFRSTSASDLDGTLIWDAATFTTSLDAVGSRYVAPAAGQPVVSVASAANNTALALGEGGLSSQVVQTATLNADNTVVLSTPAVQGITLHVSAANGRFNGSFVHPQTGVVTKFRGAILQKQNAGFGFFTGGGYATFAPSSVQARLAQPE